MSTPEMTAQELREKIDGVLEGRLIPMDLTDEDFKAIRRLLEHGLKVSRESFDKCVNRLGYWSKTERGMSEEFVSNRILDMLREAGVEVEEVANEEEPKQYRREGCGRCFETKIFSHSRPEMGKDGNPIQEKELLDWLNNMPGWGLDSKGELIVQALRRIVEHGLEVDEDWLIAKANAVLYALRRRFRSRITATDTAMMRDLLADVVMAAGIRIKKEG